MHQFLEFSGKNLRGHSFKGQNLTGANFSHADISGANFTDAILINANFKSAKAGLQKRWRIGLLLSSYLLSALSGLLLGCAGSLIGLLLTVQNHVAIVIGILVLVVLLIFFIVIIRQGFGVALGVGAVAIAILVTLMIVINSEIPILGVGYLTLALAASVALAGAGSGISILTIVSVLARVISGSKISWIIVLASVLLGSRIGSLGAINAAIWAQNSGKNLAEIIAISIVFMTTCLSIYISRRVLKEDKIYLIIRSIVISLAAIGGTSFYKANLTDADFTDAILDCTDFRKTTLIRTNFYQVKLLDRVRPGLTYLNNLRICQLLVSRQGQDKNFDRLNLRGINLKKANLQDASFIGTDLSEANLQDADLSRAKLVQTQLDKTDFTSAYLTGAFIEDWGITSDTNFHKVKCEYVYMHLPSQENPNPLRKPDNLEEIFEDGDFADFIQPIFDTLDLYHNQGVDPRAIAISFKQLAENNPNAKLEIVAMEKRGKNKFLLRAKTKPSADKSKLSAEYFTNYNQLKALTEQKLRALIAEKDSRINSLEKMITTALQRPSFYVDTQINFAQQQNLDTVALEIQSLLEKLEASNNPQTDTEKLKVIALAIEEIQKNPTLKARVSAALQAGGIQAFKEAIRHPLVNILVATIQGWHNA